MKVELQFWEGQVREVAFEEAEEDEVDLEHLGGDQLGKDDLVILDGGLVPEHVKGILVVFGEFLEEEVEEAVVPRGVVEEDWSTFGR